MQPCRLAVARDDQVEGAGQDLGDHGGGGGVEVLNHGLPHVGVRAPTAVQHTRSVVADGRLELAGANGRIAVELREFGGLTRAYVVRPQTETDFVDHAVFGRAEHRCRDDLRVYDDHTG